MNVYIFSVFLLLFAYFVIWKGVKLGKLDVRDSILWICLSIGMGVLVWRYEWLDWLAKLIGVNYPPALLFLLGFFVFFNGCCIVECNFWWCGSMYVYFFIRLIEAKVKANCI